MRSLREKKTSAPVARVAWVMPTGDQGGWGLRLGENGWGVAGAAVCWGGLSRELTSKFV